jgi:predicted metal-binding membrane protein
MSALAFTRARGMRLGGVPAVVLGAIALAWGVAIAVELTGTGSQLHHDALIGSGSGVALGLGLSTAAWVVMVAAMMLPSSLPLVRLFAQASAGQARPGAAMAGFLGGYVAVWTLFGVIAFAADLGLHRAVETSASLRRGEWAIGGSVLALAGAFQFTPLKDACLDRCRHPGAFLLRYYRRGVASGLRLGAWHGLFCVGCCWALMLVMFAAGVASLVWMGLLMAVMVHEKTRPAGRRTVPVTGTALLAVSSTVLLYSAYSAGVI